jgi:hypothetical protein
VTGAALLQMRFTVADLPRLRLHVGDAARRAGLDEGRCEELVLAAGQDDDAALVEIVRRPIGVIAAIRRRLPLPLPRDREGIRLRPAPSVECSPATAA